MLTGFVDVVAHEADGAALIVDYKTDRVGDADLEAARRGRLRRPAAHLRARGAARRRARPSRSPTCSSSARPSRPSSRYEQADAETLDAELRDRRGAAAGRRLPGGRACRTAGCAPPARGARALCSYPPELTDRELSEAGRPAPGAGRRGWRRLRSSSALSSAPKRNALADR